MYVFRLKCFMLSVIEMEQKIEKLTNEIAENYDEKKAVELNTLIDTYNFEGGNIYIKELKTGFKKFGFSESDLERPINEFSGGQSTKISLLKLLLSKPDVLMLDEPTNHLDIEAMSRIFAPQSFCRFFLLHIFPVVSQRDIVEFLLHL